MTQRLPPTLADIRTDLVTRCGLASGATVPPRMQPLLDTRIRSAHAQIYELFPWVILTVDNMFDLSLGETDYDIPDNTEPAKIEEIGIRRISDGRVFPLEPGFTLGESTAYVSQQTNQLPLRYRIIDGIIRLAPPPDTVYYDKLCMTYRLVPGPLVQDDERLAVDGESVLQLAEILMREHFGGVDTRGLRANFERYMTRLRVKQSNGAGFQMGGHQSIVVQTRPRNRFNRLGWRNSSWQDFHPW